uniref:C-type lectin domain-containing protein n=1 Tax=Timema shepardi TaxID=629360 RepID=A0A7R9AM00_TIMSH|nr:unnamed protein product [Timema shepardi]
MASLVLTDSSQLTSDSQHLDLEVRQSELLFRVQYILEVQDASDSGVPPAGSCGKLFYQLDFGKVPGVHITSLSSVDAPNMDRFLLLLDTLALMATVASAEIEFEGSYCSLPASSGVCMRESQCTTLGTYARKTCSGQYSYPVICCPDGSGPTGQYCTCTDSPPPNANPDYELIPGLGYYSLHLTSKTWLKAKRTCAEQGAHLAIINSKRELMALQGIFQLHPKIREGWQNDLAYVGFHDLYSEGEYVTILGEPLASTGYSTFANGEPTDDRNGTTGEDCGCIPRFGELNDVGCNELLPFFCEQELILPPQ